MNCSNCNVIIFSSRNENETEEIMCENEHFLCPRCYASSKTRCIKCGGRLFENIPVSQHYANRTLDMIFDWMKINEKQSTSPPPYSNSENNNFDREISGVLRETESMQLLFSRSRSLDGESIDNEIAIQNWDLRRRNQAFESMNLSNTNENVQSLYLNEQNSKYLQHIEPIEHKSNHLVKKDTRQNLVDQMKDEIRGKIKEEIFNLFKNDPRTSIKPDEFQCIKQCTKTIGVSTDSEPNILPKNPLYQESKENIIEVIDLNQERYIEKPQEYLVMNVEVDTRHNRNPNNILAKDSGGKKSSTGVDQQFQNVIETVLESGTNTTPLFTEDTFFYKMLREKFSKMPPNKLEQMISSICNNEDESKISDEDIVGTLCQSDLEPPQQQTKNNFLLISNSSRASYSPPSCHHIVKSIPNPQFQLMASAAKFPAQKVIDATTLNIPRSPIICPMSSCQQACFVSDFTRHIAVDHTNVPMERIIPQQCKNFFLDPKLIHFGSNRCQMLLLVKDKIRNLGHEKFKDFIPVLVMSTKVSTFELCSNSQSHQILTAAAETSKNNLTGGFLMIWLTGLMPPQVPIFFSLTIWARTGNMPSCHIVHSGQLYSIRNSQNATSIQESGQRLLLSQKQVDLLTNNGRNMLELQIVIN